MSDLPIFSVSFLVKDNVLISEDVIEHNRFIGFINNEFRTNTETILRAGC